ncbi:N-acetylmuramoyl-L-alanine amidase [Cognatilysobacter lacus]|uniref:N-acetylmuramoyl-L-alanine amidase n=1 Tax=Cognatilysobacter lacus TaxID=1643323 RepID=A0A5D8Z1F9_9GAMM|nr:N-acetylmuramoyl-L-alanine amidase [Lysobacter lacus]TZF88500.1 N-acetylmuramoyl-L-alanine amidase [Lysobacter lacus]
MLADLPPLPIHVDPLPYESRLESRPLSQVDLVIIHCTEVPDLAMARSYGEKVLYASSGTGNSGHFYIDRDGSLHQYVALERVANHTRGYNPRSIGIELVNTGRYPDWYAVAHQAMDEPYTAAQIDTLVALLSWLATEHPALRYVTGHEDLDTALVEASDDASRQVRRKRDPGPLFPWDYVLRRVPLQRLPPPSP